jgi:HPt (histidine-containing phosphotransfer) domain-containing protein
MMTEPAVDQARLAALADDLGDPALVRDAVRLFLTELPGRLDALRAAAAGGDPEVVRAAAHALGSPAAMLGADRLSADARAVQSAAASGAPDLGARIATMVASADDAAGAFRTYLAG